MSTIDSTTTKRTTLRKGRASVQTAAKLARLASVPEVQAWECLTGAHTAIHEAIDALADAEEPAEVMPHLLEALSSLKLADGYLREMPRLKDLTEARARLASAPPRPRVES